MSAPPILLDMIGRVSTPTDSYTTARIWVFDNHPDTPDVPGSVIVYTSSRGQPGVRAISPLISFTRSKKPRREPHVIETEAGTFTAQLAGCGCGNPIKKLSWTQALKEVEASRAEQFQPAP